MIDISSLLESIKAEPFTEMPVRAPHTGVVHFEGLQPGERVTGPGGEWKEVPGTRIATITRENNPKPVAAVDKGVVQVLHTELEGAFVEAGTELGVLRHYLSRDEVVRMLLRESLSLFRAPERAKYYFVPEIDKKVKISGSRTVSVQYGMELFIASRMKREVPLCYSGPEGIIYEVYFKQNENVDTEARSSACARPTSAPPSRTSSPGCRWSGWKWSRALPAAGEGRFLWARYCKSGSRPGPTTKTK